jgi:hypothetical protein
MRSAAGCGAAGDRQRVAPQKPSAAVVSLPVFNIIHLPPHNPVKSAMLRIAPSAR